MPKIHDTVSSTILKAHGKEAHEHQTKFSSLNKDTPFRRHGRLKKLMEIYLVLLDSEVHLLPVIKT